MGEQTVHKKAGRITIGTPSDRVFFLIHGYTGSPTDFNGLPQFLHKRFGAHVVVPRLMGHGTRVEDLDALEYEHFASQVRAELAPILRSGARVVLGGHSFGGQLALLMAAEHPQVAGVFTTTAPYRMRFPLNIPGVAYLARIRPRWAKRIPPHELAQRKDAFYYLHMPSKALAIVNTANRSLRAALPSVRCPMLTMQSLKDDIAHPKSAPALERAVAAETKKTVMLTNSSHSIFYSGELASLPNIIAEFFENAGVFA